ncbi:Glutathione S-transferase 1 [Colletotrichum tanaceti]|uniref:Glutathione S-transferase 1 n=1 Tax=Colletotrichum tanaceti TaxID=1306861 RepID=A0A4U6X3M2_9PEZI|nr:Glutathione S-transferase 1 [Colletotrichum tanaceti]
MSSTEPVALYGHGTPSLGSGLLTGNRPKGYNPQPGKSGHDPGGGRASPFENAPTTLTETTTGRPWSTSPVVKEEPYASIDINGRLPALRESGAIIECLVDTCKANCRISYPSSPQQFLVKKRLYFQISRQDTYFGQLSWFESLHSEVVPSAGQRYGEQTVRILFVLYRALGRRQYLVRNRAKYPDYAEWTARVRARPVVGDVLKTMIPRGSGRLVMDSVCRQPAVQSSFLFQ